MKKLLLIVMLFVLILMSGCDSDQNHADEDVLKDHVLSDGIYEGTAEGHRGNEAKVTVEILNNEIISILVEECGCTPDEKDGFYLNAANEIAEHMITENQVNVDAISGASNSSKAIKDAVNDALENAIIEESD